VGLQKNYKKYLDPAKIHKSTNLVGGKQNGIKNTENDPDTSQEVM
jgi:hypothetical protein